jgi:flavin reductase (DIM6/NTAB) family NADH-FMN oxidoreductase RutF
LRSAGGGCPTIANPLVGLVTWYAPNGSAMALVVSWLGAIDGHPPLLKAGCSGQSLTPDLFPAGADFAVNLPAGFDLPLLGCLLQQSSGGCPLSLAAGPHVVPARRIHAPLLAACWLQLECRNGQFLSRDWEAELVGDILLLHRGDVAYDPVDHPDFSALHPLRPADSCGTPSVQSSR